jgi:GTPase SAR1 family protein
MAENSVIFNACLKHPFCILIAGPSMCGKSDFVTRLLRNSERLIDPPPDNVVWFFGIKTKQLDALQNLNLPFSIKLVEGLPDSFESYLIPNANNLFIFDDLMQESVNNKTIANLFTRQSHHLNTSVIFVMQDLFYSGTQRKTFLRNAQYLVLFSNPLDSSAIFAVGHKIMPKRTSTFLNIFETATKVPNGYLFVDGHQTTPADARLKTDIFGIYQKVYIPYF